MNEHFDRVQREQSIYDSGSVDVGQKKLGVVLEHVNNGPSRLRRDRVLSELARGALDVPILEIGSHAWSAVFCREHMQPEDLVCINISQRELDQGREMAAAYGFHARFELMDAHALSFPDGSFGLVYGVAILHHLEFERAIKEIHRVLRPNGKIVFVEPLRSNPLAMLVRLLTPGARTVDELPLGRKELRLIERYFVTSSVYTDLFTVPLGVISRYLFRAPVNPLTRWADALDRAILRLLPSSGTIFRTVTIIGGKREFPT